MDTAWVQAGLENELHPGKGGLDRIERYGIWDSHQRNRAGINQTGENVLVVRIITSKHLNRCVGLQTECCFVSSSCSGACPHHSPP